MEHFFTGFCPCFLKFLLFPVVFGGDPSQANMQHYFKSLIQILGKDMFTFYFALIAPQLSFHSAISNTLAFPRTHTRGSGVVSFQAAPVPLHCTKHNLLYCALCSNWHPCKGGAHLGIPGIQTWTRSQNDKLGSRR